MRVFGLTFAGVALIGLVYTFAQPTIYRSQATLLVSTTDTSGQQTSAESWQQQIDTQQPILFSSELLTKTQAGLATAGYSVVSVGEIKSRLRIKTVADTSLLEIIAEGSDAELLPLIINTWLDVYLQAMNASLEPGPVQAEQPVSEELGQLTSKLNQARANLDKFRQAQGGDPGEWDKKASQSKLAEQKKALKSATQQEKRAQSALVKAQKNIARGDSVIPRGEQRKIDNLERKLDGLETKLADLDARYTRKFLELQPKLRVIPGDIEELKVEIDHLKTEGTRKVMAELQREQEEASRSVTELEQQIMDQEKRRTDSTALVDEYNSLARNVENLEKMLREARTGLKLPAVLQGELYPQFTVIERASVPDAPIGADTNRNALISLSVGLAAAVFAFWLYGFLNPVHAAAVVTARAAGEGNRNNGLAPEPAQDSNTP